MKQVYKKYNSFVGLKLKERYNKNNFFDAEIKKEVDNSLDTSKPITLDFLTNPDKK